MMCGLPRSGKSTWTKDQCRVVVISADRLRYLVYNQRFWAGGEALMWSFHGIILRLLLEQGVNVILDECNMTPKRREPIIKMAKEYGYETRCVVVPTPLEECMKRARDMNDVQIQPVIQRMATEYIPPSYDEGINDIYCVGGGDIDFLDKGSLPVYSNGLNVLEAAFSYANEFAGSIVYVFSEEREKLVEFMASYQGLSSYIGSSGSEVFIESIPDIRDLSRYKVKQVNCCILDSQSKVSNVVLWELQKLPKSIGGDPKGFKIV